LRADFKGSFKPPVEESFEDPIFLNTDEAVQLESRNTVAGRVVRNANGDWIFGYNRRLGKCSIFNVELWGILEGLRHIQRRGHDEWFLRYILRDENQVVNCLAKQALIGTDNLQVFDTPHSMMRTLMELDKNKNVVNPEKRCLLFDAKGFRVPLNLPGVSLEKGIRGVFRPPGMTEPSPMPDGRHSGWLTAYGRILGCAQRE
ncbi:hypothetical protein Gohar_010351, partial [Gossypium harknessii]|nr:hypothetical protein [Gossypium harknessii]